MPIVDDFKALRNVWEQEITNTQLEILRLQQKVDYCKATLRILDAEERLFNKHKSVTGP